MANYKETNLAGNSYIRAHRVEVINGELEKAIYYVEQKVINLDDGEVIRRDAGVVGSQFTPENASTQFKILNPATGAPVKEYDPDTGSEIEMTSTYQEVYTLLYSLYLHIAVERDAAEAAAQAEAEAEPVAEEPVEEPVVEEPAAE